MFIQKRLHQFRPSPSFFFNVHIDGLEETHDLCVERKGVFQAAVAGIRAAKTAGFLVCTNTTIYSETDMGEIEAMLDLYGVSEANWQDATKKDPHFISSETPFYVGRAVAALAADPKVSNKSGKVFSSWDLAVEYGFKDVEIEAIVVLD